MQKSKSIWSAVASAWRASKEAAARLRAPKPAEDAPTVPGTSHGLFLGQRRNPRKNLRRKMKRALGARQVRMMEKRSRHEQRVGSMGALAG